jgi:hypothetical protein
VVRPLIDREVTSMSRRIMGWFSNVVRDAEHESHPHFHQGPESQPAVCYDDRCGSPRLDVGTG